MESECFPCIPLTRASHEPFIVKSEPVSPPSPPPSARSSNTSHLSEVKQEPGIQVWDESHRDNFFKNLKKKIREPKVLRLLLNVCDFQKENQNLGYGFENL